MRGNIPAMARRLVSELDEISHLAPTNVGRSKVIAYAAVFSAFYLLLSYSVAITIGPVLRGSGAHLFRALLMVLIAARLGVPGGATMMGIISGVLLLAVPAPAAFLYFPGTVAAGLVYDLSLRGNFARNATNSRRILTGSLLSGIAESVIVTGGFFLIGFSFTEIIAALAASGYASAGIIGIWIFALGKNIIMTTVGVGFAFTMIRMLARRKL